MKRLLFMTLALAILPIVAQAQDASFGFLLGGAESTTDGLDFNLKDTTLEAFVEYPLTNETSFRVKYGTMDTNVTVKGTAGDGTIEYLDATTAYEFDESYGHSALFAGIGMYRQRLSGQSESDYGFTVGVNSSFPVTRRFALVGELGYHWANFEADTSFFTAGGGFKLSF